MNIKLRFYLAAMATVVGLISSFSQSLIINEIMQSNVDCLVDDLSDFPDSWVEVLNVSKDETVNLSDFAIGDSPKLDT